jgi:hypothetical protein
VLCRESAFFLGPVEQTEDHLRSPTTWTSRVESRILKDMRPMTLTIRALLLFGARSRLFRPMHNLFF